MIVEWNGGNHEREDAGLMRCDLHVHSWHSGRAEVPVLEHVGRECYSPPLEVHERARRRGMDLVTLTDHDTIDGALSLAHVARAFTTVPGARTKEEFLGGLRTGLTVPCGRSGSYARLTGEVARIFAAGYVETVREVLAGTPSPVRVAASLALGPLLPLIPLFTLGVHVRERRFGRRHFRAFQQAFGWPALPSERAAAFVPSAEEAA